MDLLRQCLVLRQQRNLYLGINPSKLNRPSQHPNQLLKMRHILGITFIRYVHIGLLSMWQWNFVRPLAAPQLYIILR